METGSQRIRSLDPAQPDPRGLDEAVSVLQRGELVIVPTETVYGVAADARIPGAVERIYAAKDRDERKPIAFLAADLAQVEALCGPLLPAARKLAKAYWPGPLTLVLKARTGFEGFRVPDHAVALALLKRVGVALAVTSANRSGEAPALNAAEAAAALPGVPLVLDAGPARGGVPSTVVKVSDAAVEILREGAIRKEDILDRIRR